MPTAGLPDVHTEACPGHQSARPGQATLSRTGSLGCICSAGPLFMFHTSSVIICKTTATGDYSFRIKFKNEFSFCGTDFRVRGKARWGLL